ncbi:MAG: DEAD/DEAH box helicase [Deltaproteobacteria bacterium]|nr:DEAD/DEAH box helicase [Deltaproteobacteria bacterium]
MVSQNDPVDPLSLFHPLIRKWFAEKVGRPTDIQSRAWPEIARGRHVLVTAPTGSGKTLTAFLWAINQLLTGAWGPGRTRVLYVSPLKALNNDIRRNLAAPLEELRATFSQAGAVFPPISLLTRSGDTPVEERRRMRRRPPEILITTPESLNLLLSSRSGRELLTGIVTVILDEIHAVIGSKRGTHLITAVDRLVRLSGEFQRLALSATVRPLKVVAEFVGGSLLRGQGPAATYEKRKVTVIKSPEPKRYGLEVRFPPDIREQPAETSRWPVLAEAFREVIRARRSVLFFANSRRTAEKVTRLINESQSGELAYSHHGSLSREIRLAVEQRLKNGELKAIVATSSLELGIDIGDLDLVVLIQTPPAISAAIQRIGRSGHRVGGLSRGLLYPTHGFDFLTAAVLARSVADQDIEAVRPVENPLDVLAQVILSLTGLEVWDRDELFAFLRTSYPYHRLSRRQFDLVLDMLAGRYAGTKLRELKARLSLDLLDNTVYGREGVLRLLYLSGGTIPDRGYYDLRVADSRAKIGELDEEFVWERSIGDTFALGAQVWRIQKVTANDVEVLPAAVKPGIIPFWKAEDLNRDFHFSEKILLFLESFQARPEASFWLEELRRNYFLEAGAAGELLGFLKRQQEATRAELPHRHHLLIEHFRDLLNTADHRQVILHTLWGGRINRPFGLALQAAWEEKTGSQLEIFQNNDGLLFLLPEGFAAGEVLALVTPENLERLLRRTLEQSGFFGAKFRENAGRALLLPRGDFKKRLPLWLNRLRSKTLLEAVRTYPDFPILLETWRTCLQDEFDLDSLRQLLGEIQDGRIKVTEAVTAAASPFADGLIYRQTNAHMYADDSPRSTQASRLSGDLLREVLFSQQLRPRLARDLVAALEGKLKRTAPGYAPRSAADLLDWVKERILIPAPEWTVLLEALDRDRGGSTNDPLAPVREKIAVLRLPGAALDLIFAVENLGRIAEAWQVRPEELVLRDAFSNVPLSGRAARWAEAVLRKPEKTGAAETALAELLRQWLSCYGPVRVSFLTEALGLEGARLGELLAGVAEAQEVVLDLLTEQAGELEICDRENLEILLRMARRSRQPSFQAWPLDRLPLFLAAWQGLTRSGQSPDDLQGVLDQLFGFPAAAEAWEKQFLPARLSPYFGAWLDGLIQSGQILWFGCGLRKASLAFPDDLDLFLDHGRRAVGSKATAAGAGADEIARLLPREIGRYHFLDIVRQANLDSRTVTGMLWDLVWQGRITNDAYATLRRGILTDFAPFPLPGEGGRPSRSAYNRWAATRPLSGNWYAIGLDKIDDDPIAEAERNKDRIRQLLRRYGLLFRELLAGELPLLQWPGIFKVLRLMELSGEILSGHFFEGIPGLQFISAEAFRFLKDLPKEEPVYWLNAADPASLCGIKLEALKGLLPSRLPSTHLVYCGARLVVISRRNGGALEIRTPPADPRLPAYLAFFNTLLTREFSPEKIILVEKINGRPALGSEYADPLKACGFNGGYKGLELVKKY